MLNSKIFSKKWLIPLVTLVLLAGLAFAVTQKPQAPDVTFTTLDGRTIVMRDLQGKTVLINFWATDCSGCIKEMPDLINTYQQYRNKNVEVIAVAMPYDPIGQVRNYTKTQALPFQVMHDQTGGMVKAFGNVNLTPTTFIYDKQGRRLEKTIGELDFVHLRQLLDQQGN